MYKVKGYARHSRCLHWRPGLMEKTFSMEVNYFSVMHWMVHLLEIHKWSIKMEQLACFQCCLGPIEPQNIETPRGSGSSLAHSHSTFILLGSTELLRNILLVHVCLVFMYSKANTYWVASRHKRTYDIFLVGSKMNKTNHVKWGRQTSKLIIIIITIMIIIDNEMSDPGEILAEIYLGSEEDVGNILLRGKKKLF